MSQGQSVWILSVGARGTRLVGTRKDSPWERAALTAQLREALAAEGEHAIRDAEIDWQTIEGDASAESALALTRLRLELISDFVDRQATAREWLKLSEAAGLLARERGERSETASLAELMDHACVGAFDKIKPAMLVLHEGVGVELRLCDSAVVHDIEYATSPIIDAEGLKLAREMAGDDAVLSNVMRHCWARREAVVALLRKLGVDPAAMAEWAPAGLPQESAQPETFTPYCDLDESALTPKVRLTRELLVLLWASGSPHISAQAMAKLATAKLKRLGRVVFVRGKPVTEITEDDVKRALGRK